MKQEQTALKRITRKWTHLSAVTAESTPLSLFRCESRLVFHLVVPLSMSKSHRVWNMDCKVYIGNLSEGASKSDVESSFGKYGPLRNVWVARNPPGFAFVEYEGESLIVTVILII